MLEYMHQSYVQYLLLREKLFGQLYLEVPERWVWFVKHCVFEIYDVCRDDGLDIRNITFEQIKEKYGTLRVYYTTPYQNFFVDSILKNSDDEIPEGIFQKHNILCEKIDYTIEKYDTLIRNLEKATKEKLDEMIGDILSNPKSTQTQTTANEVLPIDKHINNKL